MHPYGLGGFPKIGGGFPGLPRPKGQAVRGTSYTRVVTPGAGEIVKPDGARYMRVAAIGGGGGSAQGYGGSGMFGGGGGGCAASDIVPAQSFAYTCGHRGASNYALTQGQLISGADGGDSVAFLLGLELVGRGGKGGSNNTTNQHRGLGGIGEGGSYNFRGGSVARTGGNQGLGGGGAGPRGNGGGHHNPDTGVDATDIMVFGDWGDVGWGVGGGTSGFRNYTPGSTSFWGIYGGAGAGATAYMGAAYGGGYTGEAGLRRLEKLAGMGWFGRGFTVPLTPFTLDVMYFDGGQMGGGGSAGSWASGQYMRTNGGVGGIVVEWFY